MPDWTRSMQQTFEYYVVDPGTWEDKEKLDLVKNTTINRDAEAETLGSATIDIDNTLGECYVRVYLITIQNGIKERHPLGTFMVQTPSSSFDGKVRETSVDAYTPLMELKEDQPTLGYSILEDENIMEQVYLICRENVRAPVVKVECSETLYKDFVANSDDTYLSFLSDLMSNAKYKFGLDDRGRILFEPEQETASLQPVWTYTDDNASILQPAVSTTHDFYGIPNVVEVIYSSEKEYFHVEVVNDDPNSPTSTVNRGRIIRYRIVNPELGIPTELQLEEYANRVLRELSTVEYTITYTHGYCPVRLGDCVRLNYKAADLENVKAKVVSQSIRCEPGCPVTEKAVFPKKLWG